MFQFKAVGDKLSVIMYQRSCDMFLGVPFNMAQYGLLLHLVAQMTDLEPDEFVHVLADAHIYHKHFEAVREQLTREPLPLPQLWVDPTLRNLEDIEARYRWILTRVDHGEPVGPHLDGVARLLGYESHPAIKAEMAVGAAV